jgi:hypothetical protein
MVDVPALRKVTEHVLSLPEMDPGDWLDLSEDNASSISDAWTQGEWLTLPEGVCEATITDRGVVVDETGETCGTAGCIAGWTVMLLAPNGTKLQGFYMNLPNNTWRNVEDWATERLGLDRYEAGDLFAAANGPEAIRRVTERIIAEANED